MEYFFESHKIRLVFVNEAFDLIADFQDSMIRVALLGANRATGDFAVAADYAVTGSGYPRINANKLQPASEDIFSITSSEMSKLA
jgi:hypothetical protein